MRTTTTTAAGGGRRRRDPRRADRHPGLRDPAFVARPDELDIGRPHNHHVALGYGVHHCLGASPARLEGRIALGTLLARFPRLRLAVPPEQLQRHPNFLMHGLAALPVALG